MIRRCNVRLCQAAPARMAQIGHAFARTQCRYQPAPGGVMKQHVGTGSGAVHVTSKLEASSGAAVALASSARLLRQLEPGHHLAVSPRGCADTSRHREQRSPHRWHARCLPGSHPWTVFYRESRSGSLRRCLDAEGERMGHETGDHGEVFGGSSQELLGPGHTGAVGHEWLLAHWCHPS